MIKKDRTDLIRGLLDSYKIGVLFSPVDVMRLNSLTGWNGVAFKKVNNPRNPGDMRCVSISLDGVSFSVWSWLKSPAVTSKAVLEEYDKVLYRRNLVSALRSSVQHQMEEYRVQCIPKDAKEASCVKCGSFHELTIDHAGGFPFSAIVDAFLGEYQDPEIENAGDGRGWRLWDGGLWLSWLDFHKKAAEYQLLCRSCNSSKGNRREAPNTATQ